MMSARPRRRPPAPNRYCVTCNVAPTCGWARRHTCHGPATALSKAQPEQVLISLMFMELPQCCFMVMEYMTTNIFAGVSVDVVFIAQAVHAISDCLQRVLTNVNATIASLLTARV